MRDALAVVLLVGGALFITAGTVGLLRFPDVATRLHALTKADNVGLGLLLAGLAVRADSLLVALKLALIWALALAASTTTAQLLAARSLGRTASPSGDGR